MKLRRAIFATACAMVLLYGVAARAVTINIGSTSAAQGGAATFAVTLNGIAGGGGPANNAQLDLLIDLGVFDTPASGQACQVASRFAGLMHTETLPAQPSTPPGVIRLRLNVIDTTAPLGQVTDGDFYTCSLAVRSDAPPGPVTLKGTRENVGDTKGNILPTTIQSGVITIQGGAGGSAGSGSTGGNVPVAPMAGVQAPVAGAQAPAAGSGVSGAPVAPAQHAAGAAPGAAGGMPNAAPEQGAAGALPTAASTPQPAEAEANPAAPAATASPAARATSASTPAAAVPASNTATPVGVKAAPTVAKTPVATKQPAAAPQPAAKAEDKGGCAIAAQGSARGTWLLFVPGLVLLVVRRRSR